MNVLVTHDGSADAESALRYSALKVKEKGGGLISLYIFQGVSRSEDDHSTRFWSLDDPSQPSNSCQVSLNVLFGKGDPKAEIVDYALTERVDLVVAVPACASLFHDASIPVSIIPSTILVPMDDRPMQLPVISQVTVEALSTCSKVLLLGIVPVNLYNPSEESEMISVKKATIQAMKQAASALRHKNIQTEEMLRMGYPDEEIIKAAQETKAAMIVIHCASDLSSELSKAASIILDEIRQVNIPILCVPE